MPAFIGHVFGHFIGTAKTRQSSAPLQSHRGRRILDAGCGSARDSLAFTQRGYDVVSIEGSAAMVEAASKLTGQPALLMRFDEIEFDAEFDGIWACASLVHVPRREMAAHL